MISHLIGYRVHYSTPWDRFWQIASGSHWDLSLFWLVTGTLFLAAIYKKNTGVYMMWASWVVVGGAFDAHQNVLMTINTMSHPTSASLTARFFVYICGYCVRTSALLYVASFFAFRNQPPTVRDAVLVARTMLFAVLLLSVDALALYVAIGFSMR